MWAQEMVLGLRSCIYWPASLRNVFRTGSLFPLNPSGCPCFLHNIRFQGKRLGPSIQRWSITSSQPPASRHPPSVLSARASASQRRSSNLLGFTVPKKNSHPSREWRRLSVRTAGCPLIRCDRPRKQPRCQLQHPSASFSSACCSWLKIKAGACTLQGAHKHPTESEARAKNLNFQLFSHQAGRNLLERVV